MNFFNEWSESHINLFSIDKSIYLNYIYMYNEYVQWNLAFTFYWDCRRKQKWLGNKFWAEKVHRLKSSTGIIMMIQNSAFAHMNN